MLIAVGDIKEEPKVRGLIDQSFFYFRALRGWQPLRPGTHNSHSKILSEPDNLRLSKNLTYLE